MSPVERTKRQIHATKWNKRLRKQMRITPWKDIWELESVGRGLLSVLHINDGDDSLSSSSSSSSSSVLEALEAVTVWKARSHAMEALPHAVESTAALTQVYWRDIQHQQQHYQQQQQTTAGAIPVSVTELRLSYSSAIVRCINGYADALQQQRFLAAPVSVLCGQLGIPSWLVDIRHEASHNALPTLPVLRLAAVTLLEYLQTEYWIPTCPNWKTEAEPISKQNEDDKESLTETPPSTNNTTKAIDLLLQYKANASKSSVDSAAEDAPTGNSVPAKTKVVTPSKPRPFDTFFGDSDTSDDEDVDKWGDPLLGSLWGPTAGTNTNRFAALEPPKKIKAAPLPKKKPKKVKPKKQVDEKSYIDFAKAFVKMVSPQEGYSTAIQFLVWGGLGGSTPGRGVLIPGSAVAFPATPLGIRKSWQRYQPFLEVLGRTWPGFCAALLVHLVEFVLSIESNCMAQGVEDAGSARKLFFVSAWIRLLMSEQFVYKLFPELKPSSTTTSKGKSNTTEIPLASYEHLESMQYPLNSLCDRCDFYDDPPMEWRKTSRDILQSLQEILGPRRIANHGIHTKRSTEVALEKPAPPPTSSETIEGPIEMPGHGPALRDGKMSLDDMEALLSDSEEDEEELHHPSDPDVPTAPLTDAPELTTPQRPTISAEAGPVVAPDRPIPWTRCTAWDECAIGTLPGRPV